MQTTRVTELSSDRIATLSKEAAEPQDLLARRLAAWERFERTPFAVPRGSTLARSRVKDLNLTGLMAAALQGPRPRITVTGAPEGVRVLPWSEGVAIPEVAKRLFATNTPEDGKLELLQEACPAQGTVIHVPRGVTATEPITLDVEVSASGAALHTVIVAEATSRVDVIETLRGATAAGAQGLVTHRVEVFALDGAQVTYATVQDLPLTHAVVATKRAHHERDGRVVWVDTQLGAHTVKSEVTSFLNGRGATCQNFGAFLGSGTQEYDLAARGHHLAPNTENTIFTKGVLKDEAKSVFFGHVDIRPGASNSSGHQKSNTLLLSDRAHADALPVLDVENNEVSASHGATVGQVDYETLFYLMSRGLDEESAKRTVVEGFFEPLFREIPLERVRDELKETIVRRVA